MMFSHRLVVLALAGLPAVIVAQRPQPPLPPQAGLPPAAAPQLRQRLVLQAQGAPRRLGGAIGQPGVTRLLNLRRQLELTPRQVTQLDSIERGLFAERKAMLERMQAERRAVPPQGQARPLAPDSLRARMQRLQPQMAQWRQRDSLALASAERLLTEPQRQKLREIRAYARGRADAMRQSRRPRGGQRGPDLQMRPGQWVPARRPMPPGAPRGDQEVEVEIRRQAPGGEEVRIERRMTRPPR